MSRFTRLPLILVLAACSAGQPSLEELRGEGYRLLRRGDLVAARARASEGRDLARDKGQSSWAWTFDVLEAEVLVGQGRSVEARAILDKGLAAPGPADVVRARALMTRGNGRCFSSEGPDRFRLAGADLDEADRIATVLGTKELMGEVALRRGNCRFLERDLPGAEAHFREAAATARQDKLSFLEASATGNLGTVLVRLGRYDEAIDWFKRSLALAAQVQADAPATRNLINQGWCYYLLGDYERALSLLTRGEEQAAARGLASARLTALTLLGNTHYRLADQARATRFYERAFAIAQELGSKSDAAVLLGNRAAVAVELGRYDEAEVGVGEALRIQEDVKDETERQRLLITQGAIWIGRGDLVKAEGVYRSLVDSSPAEPGLLWQARAGLADVRVKAGRPADAQLEFRRAFALMEQTRASLREAEHRITFFSSLRRFHDGYLELLITNGGGMEALEVADRSRARLLREQLGGEGGGATATVTRFRQAARSLDAVLLAYWAGARRSLLWIVTPQKVELRTLPDEATLRRDVEAYQAAILRSRDPLAERMPEGERLWSTLVAPAAEQIRKGARVIVIPDGPLHQLNFETLVVPGPKPHYWIEDVTLAAAPSLSLLEGNRRPRRADDRRLLVIGDPVPPHEEFPRLAHAKGEVARIAELFEPARRTVFSGAEAEPAVYRKANPGSFALIHFAAHATANRESPLESAVVLSARNDAYKLYAREVIGVPLRAELVTLSACRSAGSRAYAGEGLVGLAWAFLSAGAANVVGGLWNVEDASTSELMEHLYRGIRDGLDPAQALRAAKLRLLRSGTAYRKPFYWAPFVIYTRSPAARSRSPSD